MRRLLIKAFKTIPLVKVGRSHAAGGIGREAFNQFSEPVIMSKVEQFSADGMVD